MMLSKNVLTKRYGLRVATACALMVLGVLLVAPSTGDAASKPTSIADLALYQGPDREQILIEGAKKEGKVTFYTSNVWIKESITKEFPKKYPFLKVEIWRGAAPENLKRVMEEYRAMRNEVDALESSWAIMAILAREGILQEYYSPEMRYYPNEVMTKGKNGIYFCAIREIHPSLGFNTKVVSPAEAPKTYEDLLNPKWKGKMSIAGTETGVNWIGNVVETKGLGRAFIEKLAGQNVRVQNISGAALANLVITGEVPLSPTIYDSNISRGKEQGAPVEWHPLEPVYAHVSYFGVCNKTPSPHAAMLLRDYILSKEGQELLMKGGLRSPRTDIGSLETKFKKNYLESHFTLEVLEQKIAEWENLMRLFIKK